MAEGPWKGSGEKLEDAFEDAAGKAPQGEHAVTIKVNVHHNNPGELDWEAEVVRDRDGDPASCRPVELRQHDTRRLDGGAEEARLLQAVLAGGRVQHDQRLVRTAVE